jgi:hypothetical protein
LINIFKTKEWIIPASKMKTKIEFILPLPNQVIELVNMYFQALEQKIKEL